MGYIIENLLRNTLTLPFKLTNYPIPTHLIEKYQMHLTEQYPKID